MPKMVDPPEGWRYGFPKVCDKEFKTGEEFNDWLVENGYPRKVIESYALSSSHHLQANHLP